MRKIVLIALLSLTFSFNLRFLQAFQQEGEIMNRFQKVDNLSKAVDKIISNWGNIMNRFKTTHQGGIKKITDGKRFEYFHGSSEIFFGYGLRQSHYDKYWLKRAEHFLIPKDMQKAFIEILDDFQFIDKEVWSIINLAFNPEDSKKDEVKGLGILINQPFEGKYDVMNINIRAKFKLAPDLFIERTDTSVLGDIFKKGKEKIIRKPKTLTEDKISSILEMYNLVSLKILCGFFGVNITPPNFDFDI